MMHHLPSESTIVKLMKFLKNTPSPEGKDSKAEGAAGASSRLSHSSPFPITPSTVNMTATVALGVAGLI